MVRYAAPPRKRLALADAARKGLDAMTPQQRGIGFASFPHGTCGPVSELMGRIVLERTGHEGVSRHRLTASFKRPRPTPISVHFSWTARRPSTKTGIGSGSAEARNRRALDGPPQQWAAPLKAQAAGRLAIRSGWLLNVSTAVPRRAWRDGRHRGFYVWISV